jgi:pimeloyl-ACP methyl ester carboxylesterase
VAMGEEKALNVGPSGIEMAYEQFGDPGSPPVLLLHGGGAQNDQLAGRVLRRAGQPWHAADPVRQSRHRFVVALPRRAGTPHHG